MRAEAHIGDPGGVKIPHAEILPGLYRIHESGVRHFDDALCLYRANRAQNAIPSFVLSIEEYLKGTYMAIVHKGGHNVSAGEWSRLQNHYFKLRRVKPRLDGTLGMKDLERIYGDYSHGGAGGEGSVFSRSAGECDREVTELTGHLQSLKLACIYHDWDDGASEWGAFASLSEYAQRSLAFHAMHIAKCHHDLFVHVAGEAIQLPCAITCSAFAPAPKNPFRLYASRRVMEILQGARSVLSCPRELTLNIVNASSKIGSAGGGGQNLHPLVRAVSMFLSELPALQDGDHEFSADDSGQDPGGAATMSVSVHMRVKGGTGTLRQAVINHAECDVYDGRVALILDAERIIGRGSGPEMPGASLAALFSRLGIRPCRLAREEVPRALEEARGLAEGGRLCHYPRRMVGRIRSATPEGWSGLDPQARNAVCALFLHDPAAIALDGREGLLQKRRARVVAWDALCSQKAAYDGMLAPR